MHSSDLQDPGRVRLQSLLHEPGIIGIGDSDLFLDRNGRDRVRRLDQIRGERSCTFHKAAPREFGGLEHSGIPVFAVLLFVGRLAADRHMARLAGSDTTPQRTPDGCDQQTAPDRTHDDHFVGSFDILAGDPRRQRESHEGPKVETEDASKRRLDLLNRPIESFRELVGQKPRVSCVREVEDQISFQRKLSRGDAGATAVG